MVERAYAKINLALEVLKKREDGYHEVRNLMVPIDLYDKLYFEEIEQGIELNSSIDIKDNFVYKAAQLFIDTYAIQKGVRITLEKHIPIAAGLAGGSSDAAACLRGLNRLFHTNLDLSTLANLSAQLGSDMPYCVYSKPSICYGRGEKVEVLEHLSFSPIPLTLLRFKFGLSTKAVYEAYTYIPTNRDEQIKQIIEALQEKNIEKLNHNIFNDLKTPAHSLNQTLSLVEEKLNSLGYSVFQSGSGPTHFILKRNIAKEIHKACDCVKVYQCHILCDTQQ